MPSEETNEMTRREWRELAFFYNRDDNAKEWRIFGSVASIKHFAELIKKYAEDPRNKMLSEHEHYGPYMYLEIGTWDKSEITDHWIAGPLNELLQLSATIEKHLTSAKVGEIFSLRKTFSPKSPYDLVLKIEESAFDPASADTGCW